MFAPILHARLRDLSRLRYIKAAYVRSTQARSIRLATCPCHFFDALFCTDAFSIFNRARQFRLTLLKCLANES